MQYPITPIDGRYAKSVEVLAPIMSEFGLMSYRVRVMVEWLECLADNKILPPHLVNEIDKLSKVINDQHFEKIKSIEAELRHDVKAVEYFLREHCDKKLWPWIHYGCTSEDVNNTAYSLMQRDASTLLWGEMEVLLKDLQNKSLAWKDVPMLSRTHGQPATPTTMGKELAVFHHRLEVLLTQCDEVPLLAKFNGASGNYAAHCVANPDVDWISISRKFVMDYLNLGWNPLTTQIESHDMQASLLNGMAQLCTIMCDLCNDCWLYISIGYFAQKTVTGEVGNSTMPHKVNPIDFENARGNFKLARGLARTLADELPISTWQRDLSDSTMQRAFGEVFGHFLVGLKSLQRGLGKIELRPEVLKRDLDENPEVLTEAIQTVLRKHGHTDAYEQLKGLARGHRISLDEIREFVQGLEIPDDDKNRLLALEPATYVGLSSELVDKYLV